MTDTDQPTGADSPALDEIARAIRDVARIQGTFTLRSGAVSDTYFNKYRFEADPALLKRIGETLLPLIPQEVTVLAGLRGDGIEPIGALCVIDRETGGVENLANVGFDLKALLTMSRIEAA